MTGNKAKDVNNNIIRYLWGGGGGRDSEAECGESGGRRHGQRPERVAPAAGAAEEDGRRGEGSGEEGGWGKSEEATTMADMAKTKIGTSIWLGESGVELTWHSLRAQLLLTPP